MANNESTSDIYKDFYGPTYGPFLGTSFVLGILISLSNGLVIWLALGSPKLRSLSANWFVIDLALADFVFGFDKVALIPAAFSLADRYPDLCALEGCVHFTSGIVSMSVPPMMAACRYYMVIEGVAQDSKFKKVSGFIFFTRKGVIFLIAGCWAYFFIMIGVLLSYGQMGMDPHGYCGTKRFTSVPLFLFYIGGVLSFGFVATLATFIYCRKLNEFMANQSAARPQQEQKETKAMLLMIKIAAIQPFIFQMPLLIVLAGELILPVVPIWVTRLFALLFAFNALSDAWLTITILRPFQREFRQRVVKRIFKKSGSVNPSSSVRTK